jgi:hypothetical protein
MARTLSSPLTGVTRIFPSTAGAGGTRVREDPSKKKESPLRRPRDRTPPPGDADITRRGGDCGNVPRRRPKHAAPDLVRHCG